MNRSETDNQFPCLFQRFTFESFVVGEGNRFAFEAARVTAARHKDPSMGPRPNILFLHGGSGLGKSHLMVGIAKAVLAEQPSQKAVYRRTEEFSRELYTAIKGRSLSVLRESYQEFDIFLLDHVEQMEAMERTQEEFLSVIDHLLEHGKTVALASAVPPDLLTGIQSRLKSRISWGLVAELLPPDLSTRVEILKRKLQEPDYASFPAPGEDVIHYLAARETSNVRDLEGLLNRLRFISGILGEQPTIEFSRRWLNELVSGVGRAL